MTRSRFGARTARHDVLLTLTLAVLADACAEPCQGPSENGACRVVRIDGIDPHGQLGFRFGEPLDLDGDGDDDVVAGSRSAGPDRTGEAMAWRQGGELLQRWRGGDVDGLFGNVALAVPDLDGDGHADVVVSAPSAAVDGEVRGFVEAYGLDGNLIWRSSRGAAVIARTSVVSATPHRRLEQCPACLRRPVGDVTDCQQQPWYLPKMHRDYKCRS